jgi:hypothetical protein
MTTKEPTAAELKAARDKIVFALLKPKPVKKRRTRKKKSA